MADFLSRLAERTLGTAPVVRPVIAPKFAPDPEGLRTDSIAGGEPSLEEPAPRTHHQIRQAPQASAAPVPDRTAAAQEDDADGTHPARRTEGGPHPTVEPVSPERDSKPGPTRSGPISDATDRRQRGRFAQTDPSDVGPGFGRSDHANASPLVPEPARSASGPRPTRLGEPRSPRPRVVTEGRPRGSSRPVAEDRQPAETGPGTLHHAETTSARRGAPEATQRPEPGGPPSDPSVAKGGPGEQATSLADSGPAAAPSPEAVGAPEGVPAALSLVVPRTTPEGIEHRGERGPAGTRLQEPEPPAPTIRVSIGRVEVRAITSPPAPSPRREKARPAASPSLDDYLKQRGGGRR